MILLSIDTSTAQTGLGLYDGTRVIAEMLWLGRGHHTQELGPACAQVLERTGRRVEDIKAVAVALGPGSFTSLRVGLAFAKGLALSRHLPVVGIPTLDIQAAGCPVSDLPLAAVLPAGRGRLALGWYRAEGGAWQSQGSPSVTTIDDLADRIQQRTIVCGDLSEEQRQRLTHRQRSVVLASPAACTRRPAVLAELAWTRWQAGHVDVLATLAPIYLHVAEPVPA